MLCKSKIIIRTSFPILQGAFDPSSDAATKPLLLKKYLALKVGVSMYKISLWEMGLA